jgi:hypothetical protein
MSAAFSTRTENYLAVFAATSLHYGGVFSGHIPGMVSKRVKLNANVRQALPGNQLCYPGIVSKRVKPNTNVEGGHSQGTSFVTLAWSQSV